MHFSQSTSETIYTCFISVTENKISLTDTVINKNNISTIH